MASSENQGLQIALIIFIILVVILSLTTVLFFRSYQEAEQKAKQRSEEATSEKEKALQKAKEFREMLSMIGLPDLATIEDVRTAYNEDMQKYASTVADEKKKYREVLPLLWDSISEANRLLALEQQTVKDLKADVAAIQAAAQGQVVTNQNAVTAVEQERDKERDALRTTVEDTKKAQAAVVQKVDTRLAELSANQKDLQDQNATLENDLINVKNQRDEAIEAKRELEPKDRFEYADGEIVRVDSAKGTVWINLGRADKLGRQTTFSVHDAANHRLDQVKAHIEVRTILLDHLAEARITHVTDAENPVIPGDHIYSSAWKAGRQLRFALAGWMDIDGDGKSDRRMVKHLIEVANGVIDAEVEDSGHRTGSLSIHTRYLVLGEQPEVAARDAEAGRGEEAVRAFKDIRAEAEKWKVEEIGYNRFLDLVGYKARTVVLPYDGSTDPANFRDPPPDGGRRPSLGRLNDGFRERRPPSGAEPKSDAAGSRSGY